MEFGKVTEIQGIDWQIPPDDPQNEGRFSINETSSRVYIGGTAWGTKAWVGKLYPQKTRPEEFLSYYAKNFNCIELNASHYKIPDAATIESWLESVPAGFKFCPKLHKDISHSRWGLLDPSLLKAWTVFLEGLKEARGPCFIQFHENFSYEEKNFLFRFIEQWPSEFELSIELRHKSWFDDHKILSALTDYLFGKKVGLVTTDVAGRRDVLHTSITTDRTMLRLIGHNLDISDQTRLTDWSNRIKSWHGMGVRNSYIFLHQPDDKMTPEFALLAEKTFSDGHFEGVPHLEFIKERDLFNQE